MLNTYPFSSEGGELIEERIRTDPERVAAVLGKRPRARILLEAPTDREGVAPGVEGLHPPAPPAHGRRAPRPPYRRAPREEPALMLIDPYPWSAPLEEVRLKKR